MATEKQLANASLAIQEKETKLSKVTELANADNSSNEDRSACKNAAQELEQAQKKYNLLQKEYNTRT